MRPYLITLTLCTLALAARGAREAPVTVTRGDIVSKVEVTGKVEAGGHLPVMVTSRQWRGKWVVEEAVEPGTVVAEGDVVLRFSSREIARAFEKSARDLAWARVDFEIAEARRSLKEDSAEQALERQEYALHTARRNLAAYQEVALANARKRAELDEASFRFGLENAREELAQLLKMYEEDELLDDTETIVLERARWDVRNREARLALWLKQRSYTIEFEEKVRLEVLGREVEKLERELGRAREEAKLAQAARRIEKERARHAFEEREQNHGELEGDFKAMTVLAPASGVLLHGPLEGGLDRRFRRGTAVDLSGAVVTIADPGALLVVFTVPEAQALLLEPGVPVRIVPGAHRALPSVGEITGVAPLPRNGSFRTEVAVEGGLPMRLLGTSCKGHLDLRVARNALLVPLKAVVRDAGKTFVRVAGPDGGPTRRVEVKLGAKDTRMVEVREGVAEGDILVLPEKGR